MNLRVQLASRAAVIPPRREHFTSDQEFTVAHSLHCLHPGGVSNGLLFHPGGRVEMTHLALRSGIAFEFPGEAPLLVAYKVSAQSAEAIVAELNAWVSLQREKLACVSDPQERAAQASTCTPPYGEHQSVAVAARKAVVAGVGVFSPATQEDPDKFL